MAWPCRPCHHHGAPPSLLPPLKLGHHVSERHHTSLDLPSHATVEEEVDSRRTTRAQDGQYMPMTSRGYAQGRPRTRTGHAQHGHLAPALDPLSTRGASPGQHNPAGHARVTCLYLPSPERTIPPAAAAPVHAFARPSYTSPYRAINAPRTVVTSPTSCAPSSLLRRPGTTTSPLTSSAPRSTLATAGARQYLISPASIQATSSLATGTSALAVDDNLLLHRRHPSPELHLAVDPLLRRASTYPLVDDDDDDRPPDLPLILRLQLKEDLQPEEWEWLIQYFGTDQKFKEVIQKNSDNRKKLKTNHTAGSKPYCQLSFENRNKETGEEPDCIALWEITHFKNGSWTTEESKKVYKLQDERDSMDEKINFERGQREQLEQRLEEERADRERMMELERTSREEFEKTMMAKFQLQFQLQFEEFSKQIETEKTQTNKIATEKTQTNKNSKKPNLKENINPNQQTPLQSPANKIVAAHNTLQNSRMYKALEFLTKEVTGRKGELDEVIEPSLIDQNSTVPEDVPVQPTPIGEEANDDDHETSNEEATEPRRSMRERTTPDWYDPCLNVMIVDNNDEDPATYEEAMMSPDSNKWQEAMKSEMGSMYDNLVWTLVDLPDSRKAFENKWIFKRKTDADGNITVYKDRLVAKGFRQIQGVDYDETFSPVVKLKSSRYVFRLNGAAVSWMSSKQCTVAKSSTKSEYIVASEVVSIAICWSQGCKMEKMEYNDEDGVEDEER
ncbi:hypothetical protein QYE76_001709 [Lolium multiflorum]|uniref:Reverse transcriptase Ty1/copia-type domain-containing protein n=1 Tax=Lolium multiflorum TaxID=4521 RepID=A0AAD8VYV2_LOLMU|nr:hypothetical protein QYE76_001709 [Lolium multiflorum]